jgi:copper(I)-binding protein
MHRQPLSGPCPARSPVFPTPVARSSGPRNLPRTRRTKDLRTTGGLRLPTRNARARRAGSARLGLIFDVNVPVRFKGMSFPAGHEVHRRVRGKGVVGLARLGRTRFLPVLGGALALALSGCAAGQISQTANQQPAIDGANSSSGAVALRDVRFAAPEDNAHTAGSDVALKFWIVNTSLTPETLTEVSSPGAESGSIEGNVEVPGNSMVEVGQDSGASAELTGITADLPYGHSLPVTFTFANSGAITLNVPVEIPEQRESESRETIHILPEEPGNIWFGEEEEHSEGSDGEHSDSESGSESGSESESESESEPAHAETTSDRTATSSTSASTSSRTSSEASTSTTSTSQPSARTTSSG